MKLIFLGHYGVVVTPRSSNAPGRFKLPLAEHFEAMLSRAAVKRLGRLIRACDPAWGEQQVGVVFGAAPQPPWLQPDDPVGALVHALEATGFKNPGGIFFYAACAPSHRIDVIQWIAVNENALPVGEHVRDFVVLSPASGVGTDYAHKCVQTRFHAGLQDRDVEKALRILRIK